MNPKKNKNGADPFTTAPTAADSLPQSVKQEWNNLTKTKEYQESVWSLMESKKHQRYLDAINSINEIMEDEEQLSQKTPYLFQTYPSRIEAIAHLTCTLLRQIALYNNHDAIRGLAILTIGMTETLTELLTKKSQSVIECEQIVAEINKIPGIGKIEVESNAQVMRAVARNFPYWPMLRFRNAAANSEKQFHRIAEELELGKKCQINVSERANYSLETPINSFVWKCLTHFRSVHSWVQFGFRHGGQDYGPANTFEEAVEFMVKFEKSAKPVRRPAKSHGIIKREDIPIYKISVSLPPLTKSTVKEWTDKAVLPYVCSNYPDFSKVPEFAGCLKRSGVKTRGGQRREIRRDILRSLISMARK
jgi:hypothetical protein